MKPPSTKPCKRFRVEFDLDLWWHVRWKDNRGNRCTRAFGTEAAAKEWAEAEEARDGQPDVKGQT